MAKPERVVDTRGGAADTPNWRFGITADIPRATVPEVIEGLDYYSRERLGGSYFYPDYVNNKLAVAFEWYLRYRGSPFGYRVGIEFWVTESNLQQIGAYVLYGPDHPLKGQQPKFSKSEQAKFQKKILSVLQIVSNWRNNLTPQTFFTVHYLELHQSHAIHRLTEIPALNAHIMPTVLMGKENSRVSAVIHSIQARFREEARAIGGHSFAEVCALLTLATGEHYHGYRSTLGKTALKQFLKKISPLPVVEDVYPKGKYKLAPPEWPEFSLRALESAAECRALLNDRERSAFDRSLFAFYVAKDLLGRRFTTVSAVALIAALKPFRSPVKCEGHLSCDTCGSLNLRHELHGEASSLAVSLAELFGLEEGDEKRNKLESA